MRKNTRTTAYEDESRLFYIALFTCFMSVCGYMYFVSASVMHVVMRKELDSQIATLSTLVSQLEEEYIEMQHSVSSEIASTQGFVVANKKIFIDKAASTLVLSRN